MTLVPFSYQGSKLRELKELSEFIPKGSNLIEPFLGTGIVSGTFGSNKCIVNDYNSDIYWIWIYSKQRNQQFFDLCREYMQEENRYDSYYYEKRQLYNETFWNTDVQSIEHAALFYYIINSCHGGMVRFGPNGFNSSFKLFLANGREYRVNEKIELLKSFSDKFIEIHNSDAVDFLKSIDHLLDSSSVIYCDPPYTNSVTSYIDAWTNEKLLELDEYLYFLFKKKGIYSIMSNYNSDFDLKGVQVKQFEKIRLARTEITISNNVILTYGYIGPVGLEKLYYDTIR